MAKTGDRLLDPPSAAALSAAADRPLPAGRGAADGLAMALLDHCLHGTRAEQLFVYRACARVLGVGLEEDLADAVETVQTCQADEGSECAPSRDVYRAWWERQDPRRQWPTAEQVAQQFGGRWSRVRAVLDGEPVATFDGLRVAAVGAPRTDERLLAGIRRWHRLAPDRWFRFDLFRSWAATQPAWREPLAPHAGGDDPGAAAVEPYEFAFSVNTYVARFGSWGHALAAAGVLDGISFEVFRRLVRNMRGYSDERLLGTLRDAAQWAQERHGRALTRALLDEFRVEALRRSWEEGRLVPVPSGDAIVGRYGSLPEAMLQAGIIDAAEARRRAAKRGVKLSTTTLAAHVKLCAAHCGLANVAELSEAMYTRWRHTLVEALGEPVPASITIVERLGVRRWPEATVAVEAMGVEHTALASLDAKHRSALKAAGWELAPA